MHANKIKSQNASFVALLLFPVFVLTGISPGHAQAQNPPMPASGYVQSLGGTVKSGYGLCWRTGYWTPQMATEECDPDLVPRKQAQITAPPAVVQRPAEPTRPMVQSVTYNANVLFDSGSANLKPAAQAIIDEFIVNSKKLLIEGIRITGHTDSAGSEELNQKLSERRAERVRGYMTGHGVPSQRITAEGRGELEPMADNSTREGQARNRRVEIQLVGKPAQ